MRALRALMTGALRAPGGAENYQGASRPDGRRAPRAGTGVTIGIGGDSTRTFQGGGFTPDFWSKIGPFLGNFGQCKRV